MDDKLLLFYFILFYFLLIKERRNISASGGIVKAGSEDRNASMRGKYHLRPRKIPLCSLVTNKVKKTIKSNTGTLLESDKLIRGVLNYIFSCVCRKENTASIPAPRRMYQGPDEQTLEMPDIDISEVRIYMQTIDSNKSNDPDDISGRALKQCSS